MGRKRKGMMKMMMGMKRMKQMKEKWDNIPEEEKNKMKCMKWLAKGKAGQKKCNKMTKFSNDIMKYFKANRDKFEYETTDAELGDIEMWGRSKQWQCSKMAACKHRVMPL